MHMPTWKYLLLQAYYHGTVLPRRAWNAWQAQRGQAPIVMIYYHRIADDNANCWTIGNELFARHVNFLQRHFELISLEESQRRIRSGRNERPAVHITFDDGYAENCDHALPLLIRKEIPFTYFVTSKSIFDGIPFPHDVKNQRPLAPNTLDEIKALAAAGVEIGAHSQTHANLGTVTDSRILFNEVVECRHELEAAIGCRVRYFAFPFGLHEHLNVEAFHLARRHGYEGICSAYGGYNFPGGDAYHLHRFDASPVYIQFRNWMMIDPLKQRRVKPFQYEPWQGTFTLETRVPSTPPLDIFAPQPTTASSEIYQ
jgi:peptidoglycan/xylan/chitin deacetylase (PgdA/CDA1 family)